MNFILISNSMASSTSSEIYIHPFPRNFPKTSFPSTSPISFPATIASEPHSLSKCRPSISIRKSRWIQNYIPRKLIRHSRLSTIQPFPANFHNTQHPYNSTHLFGAHCSNKPPPRSQPNVPKGVEGYLIKYIHNKDECCMNSSVR